MKKVPSEVIVGIVDAVVILIGLIVRQWVPEYAEMIMYIIVALQPVAIALLLFFFGEEVAAKIAAKVRNF